MDGGSTEIVGEGSVPELEDLERWWNNPGIAAWSFALFGCFLLNVTLLLAFLIRPGLRTISNRFVMNLTVSNLLMCAILNPLLVMDCSTSTSTLASPSAPPSGPPSSTDATSIGSLCAISEGATALITTSSVLSVLLIAVDQYFAVVDPLRYRSRIDKLKSGILIVSVWLISAVFGILAFFNPNPRGFWLSCSSNNGTRNITRNNVSFDSTSKSILTMLENETIEFDVGEIPRILEAIESVRIDPGSIGVTENSTIISKALNSESITYGLVYAVVHTVFAYLMPFAAVCWIYVSIYTAAHRNSERTRRTGSRPILASASFCEDQNGLARQQQQGDTMEDFRRIPKISSLSSIDETSETTQPASQVPRRRSFSSSSEIGLSSGPIDENTSSGIVFTVGSQRVQVSPQRTSPGSTDNDRANRVPIATLKAEFLENNRESSTYEDLVRSKFRDRPDQRRKSSHDLMYEEMLARGSGQDTWISGDSSDGNSDSEDEAHFEYFDSLTVPERTRKSSTHSGKKYYSVFRDYQATLTEDTSKVPEIVEQRKETNEEDIVILEENVTTVALNGNNRRDGSKDELVHFKMDVENRRRKIGMQQHDDRSSCRTSTTFSITDVILNVSEDSNAVSKKTGRNANVSETATEPSACLLAPIVTITPAPNKNGTLHRVASVRSTSSYINSLKYRISNGSLFKYREETRAARISALVIVMGLICWSPYVILLVMKNLPRYSDHDLPHKYDALAFGFLILAAYVSPMLFGYRSKRVKRELRKFFCFKRELSYKNNRSLMAKKVLKRKHSGTLSHFEMDHKYNIFNCVYGRSRWPKDKVQFVQVPDTALAVETCRSSFSSGASTQISSTSTEEC